MKLTALRLRALRVLVDADPGCACFASRTLPAMMEVGYAQGDWLIAQGFAVGEPHGPTPTRIYVTEKGRQEYANHKDAKREVA